jgi:hypothetical protein
MILERRTYIPKLGKVEEVVDLIKEAHGILDTSPSFRVLTPQVGPFGVVVHEIEHEDWEAREKFGADLARSDEWAGFLVRWRENVEQGGGNEFWTVRE